MEIVAITLVLLFVLGALFFIPRSNSRGSSINIKNSFIAQINSVIY